MKKVTSEMLIRYLRYYASKNKLTKSGFAKLADIDDKTLKNFWEPGFNPTLATIKKLERIMK